MKEHTIPMIIRKASTMSQYLLWETYSVNLELPDEVLEEFLFVLKEIFSALG